MAQATLLTTVMGMLFIFFGLLLGVLLLRQVVRARRSRTWPSVWGELDMIGWRKRTFRDPRTGHRTSMGRIDVRYRYTVDGQDYTGTRMTFSDNIAKTRRRLDALVSEHRNSRLVKVYYNPQHPADSVLLPGTSRYNYTPFITVGLFIVIGVTLLIHPWE